jgi:hypothetical protein
MPLPGGQSDKFGNPYEDRWTVRCAFDVLDDVAEAIRLEPPGEPGAGVEFWIRFPGRIEFHQCKRQRTGEGHWTLAALRSAGVLSTFFHKLSRSDAHCTFVSTHAAGALDELATRARAAMTADEFNNEFLATGDWRTEFDRLCRAWGDPDLDVVFDRLRRIHVETVSVSEDEPLLEATFVLGLPRRQ